jgi:hypothetical protein
VSVLKEIVRGVIVLMAAVVGVVAVTAAVVEAVDVVGAAVDETDAAVRAAAVVEGIKDLSPRICTDFADRSNN